MAFFQAIFLVGEAQAHCWEGGGFDQSKYIKAKKVDRREDKKKKGNSSIKWPDTNFVRDVYRMGASLISRGDDFAGQLHS